MKILMINYEYPPLGGGGGVLCRDLAEALGRQGHDITVITSSYQDAPAFETVNGVAVHRVPVFVRTRQNVASMLSMLSYVPFAVSCGKRILAADKFDLINTYFAVPSGPAGYFLARRFGIPNVLHILGGDIYDPSKLLSPHRIPLLKHTVRKMIRCADRVVAESSDIKGKAERYYAPNREIDVVPLAVKPVSYDRISRTALGLAEERPVFICVGRLVARKNLHELIDIFARLRQRLPSQLVIVGEGPERAPLESKIRELHLEDSVRFTGRVSEVEKYQFLSAADIYVSTALHEGFGIVFLEAMECGLPVVCYDRGGQTDFLSSGRTGFVIGFGDREQFVRQCLTLAGDRERRAGISDHNASYVKNFHVDKLVERNLKIFREIAGLSHD